MNAVNPLMSAALAGFAPPAAPKIDPRMNLLNELRQIATATRIDALKLHDSTAKSVALARADQLGDMCAATAELLDAVAGYLGYQDSMHLEAVRDAFRRVNGSHS